MIGLLWLLYIFNGIEVEGGNIIVFFSLHSFVLRTLFCTQETSGTGSTGIECVYRWFTGRSSSFKMLEISLDSISIINN